MSYYDELNARRDPRFSDMPLSTQAQLDTACAEVDRLRFLISEVIETKPVTEACRNGLKAAIKP